MKNRVSSGENLTLVAPAGGVVSGAPVKIGNILAVPQTTAVAGAIFAGLVEGEYDVAKTAGQAFAYGDTVYWDNVNFLMTSTVGGNAKAGYCSLAAAAGDATVRVRLIPAC